MFVSCSASSNSRSFLLSGDERGVPLTLEDATDSARDVRPEASRAGVAERPRRRLFVAGRDAGGRIVDVVRLTAGGPGLGRPDMSRYVGCSG